MRARRLVASTLATLCVAALSGCGDDVADPSTTEPTSTDDGLTAPGATLAFGDTATVPRTDGTGVVEVTVTGIVEGDPADLRAVDYDATEGETPYYVSYDLRLVSGSSDGLIVRDYLSAWAGGRQVGDLVAFGAFPPCQEKSLPTGAAPGTEVSSCRTYLVDQGGAPVDTVRFDNDDAYENGDGTQITWQ